MNSNIYDALGLTLNQYNQLMGLSGALCGFIFCLFLILIIFKI